jgi:hypothetical protein
LTLKQNPVILTDVKEEDEAEPTLEITAMYCTECEKVIRGFHYICTQSCGIYHDHDILMCKQCYVKESGTHPRYCMKKRGPQHEITRALSERLCQCPEARDQFLPAIYTLGEFHSMAQERGDTDFLGHLKSCKLRRFTVNMAQAQRDWDRSEDKETNPWARRLFATFPKLAGRLFYPMGNVHTSIMFGPLLFENGVAEYASYTYLGTILISLKLSTRSVVHVS